jgi:hypothetical protein
MTHAQAASSLPTRQLNSSGKQAAYAVFNSDEDAEQLAVSSMQIVLKCEQRFAGNPSKYALDGASADLHSVQLLTQAPTSWASKHCDPSTAVGYARHACNDDEQ